MFNQIPISDDGDIEVELHEPKYKDDTNRLKMDDDKRIEWTETVTQNSTSIYRLKYSIGYPHNVVVDGLH